MHPSHPTPPPALFKWSTLLRWVSPVLLVSIALHGLAVLVPVPEREDIVEEPEIEELEPIQISTLPPGALDPEEPETEVLIAPPPPPPPPEPEPEPTPEILAEPPVSEEIPLESEIPVDPIEPEEEPEVPDFEPENEPEGEQPEGPDPAKVSVEKFDPTGTDPLAPGGLDGFTRFNQVYAAIDSSLVPHNFRTDTYSLDYIGTQCFEDREEVTGSLGVVLKNEPKLEDGVITISTGFSSVNNAILEWFEQMKAGEPGDTDKLESTFGEDLYAWIDAQRKGKSFEGEGGEALDYEAYQFNIIVDLSTASCQ